MKHVVWHSQENHSALYLILDNLTLQKGRLQLPIHRAHSVPDLIKEGSVRRFDSLGGMFRVIPTTPRVKDGTLTASIATLIDADGINIVLPV